MKKPARTLLALGATGLFVLAPFAVTSASAEVSCGPEDATNPAAWPEYASPETIQVCQDRWMGGGGGGDAACNPTDPTSWPNCPAQYMPGGGGEDGGDAACNPTDPTSYPNCPAQYMPGGGGEDGGGTGENPPPCDPEAWGGYANDWSQFTDPNNWSQYSDPAMWAECQPAAPFNWDPNELVQDRNTGSPDDNKPVDDPSGTGSDSGSDDDGSMDQAGLAAGGSLPKTGGAPLWLIPLGLGYVAFGSALVWPDRKSVG